MNDDTTRRHVLAFAGGTMIAGFAGCLDDSDAKPAGETDNEDTGTAPDFGDGDGDDHDHDHDHGHELGRPEAHIEVSMESDNDTHHFIPHIVHVEEGGTVTWILESGAHDTVAYHPDNANLLPSSTERRIPDDADPWASDLYRTEGETFERRFERAGVYDYVCTVVEHGHGPDRGRGHHGHHRTHEATGMVGRVIVGWPEYDADTQPALRAPPGDIPDSARREFDSFNEQTREGLRLRNTR